MSSIAAGTDATVAGTAGWVGVAEWVYTELFVADFVAAFGASVVRWSKAEHACPLSKE